MSASKIPVPGGQPSTTQPIAGPWDSPKEVTVKGAEVLPDMGKEGKLEWNEFNTDPMTKPAPTPVPPAPPPAGLRSRNQPNPGLTDHWQRTVRFSWDGAAARAGP